MLIWLIVVREIDIFCPNYAKILGHFICKSHRLPWYNRVSWYFNWLLALYYFRPYRVLTLRLVCTRGDFSGFSDSVEAACVAERLTPGYPPWLTSRTLDLEVRGSSLARRVVSSDKERYSTLSLFTQGRVVQS